MASPLNYAIMNEVISMKPKVFVVQQIPEIALDILREAADVFVYPYNDRQISTDELVASAKRSDWLYVLPGTIVTAEVINANPNLKGIGSMGSSPSYIDMQAANARKLPIIMEDPNVGFPGWQPTSADMVVGKLLGLAYRLLDADRYTRCGKFRQEQTMALMGVGCPGKTVGLVGMIKVAELWVPRIRAFEMQLLYTLNRLPAEREQALGLEWTPDLDDLLKRSDFVCIACDYGPSTHKLIGKRELDLMKPEAYLINTRWGRIIDEPELIRALREKRIAGAALDVYWNQPPPPGPPIPEEDLYKIDEELFKLDNVMLSPHIGGSTRDVRSRRALSVSLGMVQMMRGGRPPTLRNPEIYANA
jgi:phosphoglycerate dehydrogenase-like enzyme